ncbi:hypothetical protein DdX_18453 [Ditylenchus destructor]|uniref:Uncharacterized protein n=1 Tax=Ditylenchus destructor TaxID=166010 RepID=A0AAD4MK76_9BILA|nr:hypothetical protein DdX_18453 [Ditylenchus destructor]
MSSPYSQYSVLRTLRAAFHSDSNADRRRVYFDRIKKFPLQILREALQEILANVEQERRNSRSVDELQVFANTLESIINNKEQEEVGSEPESPASPPASPSASPPASPSPSPSYRSSTPEDEPGPSHRFGRRRRSTPFSRNPTPEPGPSRRPESSRRGPRKCRACKQLGCSPLKRSCPRHFSKFDNLLDRIEELSEENSRLAERNQRLESKLEAIRREHPEQQIIAEARKKVKELDQVLSRRH